MHRFRPRLSRAAATLLCLLALGAVVGPAAGCQSSRRAGPADGRANVAEADGTAPSAADGPGSAAAMAAAAATLQEPAWDGDLEAVVVPPVGWQPDPLKASGRHTHRAWISPSGKTAYGVIRMNLPLPFIGPDLLLGPFIKEMRKSEGEARLLSRRDDRKLGGIRFVADGGRYTIRTNLLTRGWRGWAVYAGTLRGHEIIQQELDQAEAARERTGLGKDAKRRLENGPKS